MTAAAGAKLPLPPFHRFRDVLPPGDHAALLEWTLENRERFSPSTVLGGILDPARRISERVRPRGPVADMLDARMRALFPEILRRTGSRPFELEHVELEIAAHGDGAFYQRHSDIPYGEGRRPLGGDASGTQDRLVSAVYYYHREPKGFSGGALRLFRFGAGTTGAGDWIDIEPEQNSLIVFPSWAPHEVRKVRCPSGRFEDHRFAVNAWFCRTLS